MFKILLCLSILLSFSKAQWQSISPLSIYTKASDFKLKKGITYLEIRAYVEKPKKKGYRVLFSTDKEYVKKMPRKLKNTFKGLKAISRTDNNIYLERDIFRGESCKMLYNAVIVRDDSKIYKMNTREDIRSFLGEIDTKGEIALLLWLHSESNMVEKYKQTKNGFEMIGWYKPLVSGEEKCIDTQYQQSFNHNMEYIKEKIIQEKQSNRDCLGCILPVMQECR